MNQASEPDLTPLRRTLVQHRTGPLLPIPDQCGFTFEVVDEAYDVTCPINKDYGLWPLLKSAPHLEQLYLWYFAGMAQPMIYNLDDIDNVLNEWIEFLYSETVNILLHEH